MTQPDLRTEARIAVSLPGILSLGDASAPCLVQNMCSRGFLIKYTKELPVGQILQLTCELDSERTVECKVQVRHVNRECLGARVIEISEDAMTLCHEFLEERSSAQPS